MSPCPQCGHFVGSGSSPQPDSGGSAMSSRLSCTLSAREREASSVFHREYEEHIANEKSGRKALTAVFLKKMSLFCSVLPDSACVIAKIHCDSSNERNRKRRPYNLRTGWWCCDNSCSRQR